jgi:hypothetical protein
VRFRQVFSPVCCANGSALQSKIRLTIRQIIDFVRDRGSLREDTGHSVKRGNAAGTIFLPIALLLAEGTMALRIDG